MGSLGSPNCPFEGRIADVAVPEPMSSPNPQEGSPDESVVTSEA